MKKVVIKEEICKGCGLCVNFCPKKILAISKRLNTKGRHPAEVTDPEKCIGCKSCALMCPDVAIEIYED